MSEDDCRSMSWIQSSSGHWASSEVGVKQGVNWKLSPRNTCGVGMMTVVFHDSIMMNCSWSCGKQKHYLIYSRLTKNNAESPSLGLWCQKNQIKSADDWSSQCFTFGRITRKRTCFVKRCCMRCCINLSPNLQFIWPNGAISGLSIELCSKCEVWSIHTTTFFFWNSWKRFYLDRHLSKVCFYFWFDVMFYPCLCFHPLFCSHVPFIVFEIFVFINTSVFIPVSVFYSF